MPLFNCPRQSGQYHTPPQPSRHGYLNLGGVYDLMKMPGRPLKPSNRKHIRRNITVQPENDKYILEIIGEMNLSESGHYSRIVNEIIKDHRRVKRYQEKVKAQKLAEIDEIIG